MKGRLRIGLVALLGASVAWAATRGQEPLSREAHWREVDEAVQAGLPRTAIEQREAISAAAQAEGAQAEALRASGRRGTTSPPGICPACLPRLTAGIAQRWRMPTGCVASRLMNSMHY